MIATIMLSTMLASLAFVLAAYCAERGLHAIGRPTRAPWVVASVATIVVPFGQLLALWVWSPTASTGANSAQLLPITTILTSGVVERLSAAAIVRLEYWLLGLWICASLVLLVRLHVCGRALERLARSWKRGEIVGTPAWISESYGPAVVGLDDAEIVVPRRIADLPLDEQRLAVAHELEHIAARDQWLVRMSALAVVVAPWNPFAWVATRRLRSAIEIDCDARVLRTRPNVNAYASLVLNVASWPRESPAGALALGETAFAQLERRLRLMTSKRTSRRAPAILGFAGAVALLVYGCEVAVNVEPPDTREALTSKNEVHMLPRVVVAPPTVNNGPYFEFQVEKPVTIKSGSASPRYPQALREAGVEGELLVQFVVDEQGRAEPTTFKVLKTSHEQFGPAVLDALPGMRFDAAEVGGKKVKQLVQAPFVFAIKKR
jgi:bla regulator protein blaR1